jgi:hypothetical protein
MNTDVTDFIQNIKVEWQADVCQQLREVVHQAIPGVQERIQYNKPHFLKNGKYAAVIGTAKAFVSFTIFNATNIEALEGFFEKSDVVECKTIKVRESETPDYELLGKLLQDAAATIPQSK